nr:EOG090X09QP [Polyphemus pediculus]
MASGFRCLSLRAACPSNPIRNPAVDLAISRIYGASFPSNVNSYGVSLYADRPKALAIPRFHSLSDLTTEDDKTTTRKSYELADLDAYIPLLERQYTAMSLIQHMQAQEFVNNYKTSDDTPHFHGSFNDIPELESTLENVDKQSFSAYFSSQLSNDEKNLLSFNCTPELNAPAPSHQENLQGLPSPSQLQHVFDVLSSTLPKLFIQPLDYKIYSPDIVFENRIRGIQTQGIYNYVKQVALLRCYGHLKFAFVKFEILKITQHPEDGTIKVRWRINGISGMKIFLTFWRYKLWKWREMMEKQEMWYDGFSTFHVSSNGLVTLHVADKMMPDEEKSMDEKTVPLGAKLALLLGLLPRQNWNDMTDIVENLLIKIEKEEP